MGDLERVERNPMVGPGPLALGEVNQRLEPRVEQKPPGKQKIRILSPVQSSAKSKKKKRNKQPKTGDDIAPEQGRSNEEPNEEEDEEKNIKKVFPGPSSLPGSWRNKAPERKVASGSPPPKPDNATLAFNQASTGILIFRRIGCCLMLWLDPLELKTSLHAILGCGIQLMRIFGQCRPIEEEQLDTQHRVAQQKRG